MDKGRFRSTGGRNGDYENEEQYLEGSEQEAPPDERERPVRKARPSSMSPAPRRSRNPSNPQDVYYTRREQRTHQMPPNQPTRRDLESREHREGRRREQLERGREQRQQGEGREQRAHRTQYPHEDYYEEAPRRLRASRPPVHRQAPRHRYSDEDQLYARPARSARSASQARRTQRIDYETRPLAPQRSSRPAQRSSPVPSLLGGCVIGIVVVVLAVVVGLFWLLRSSQGGKVPIIGGGSPAQVFQRSDTQTISISALSQLQICDTIGNVSVAIDPNASSTKLTATKIVHATSQSNANQEFGRIGVAVQQPASLPATPTCAATTATPTSGTPGANTPTTTAGSTNGILTVQATIPNTGSLLPSTSDAVNIQLVLSSQAFAGAASAPQLYIEASIGDINVNGNSSNGLGIFLNIHGSNGNVSVSNSKLISGSRIGTGQGSVTFNGSLASPQDTTTNASFIFQDEKGQIDVTLPTTTNVVLSANTNVGTIRSDFPITPTTDGNSSSFRGHLNPSAAIQSIAVLTLNVSTGNITIHKA